MTKMTCGNCGYLDEARAFIDVESSDQMCPLCESTSVSPVIPPVEEEEKPVPRRRKREKKNVMSIGYQL